MDKYYVSPERLEALRTELENLKTKARLEVAEQLKRAKEYGDLSENSEYAEAKEEQSRVEARIFELEDLLKRAEIIEEGAPAGDAVEVGSTVAVEKDGKKAEYRIVGSSEAKPEIGLISNESPLGKAFIGRKRGETVEVITPGGKVAYRILKIS